MGGDGDVPDASSVVSQEHQDENEATRYRRHDEEVGRHDLAHVIRQERAPRLGWWPVSTPYLFRDRRLRDVDPTFKSSPWIRGAPQRGLASAMVRMSVRTSVGVVGRPRRRRLFQVHHRRTPRRCQAMTVSGFTMTVLCAIRSTTARVPPTATDPSA